MQTACIEFARNVCGLKDADSTEFNPDTPFPIIFKLRDLVDVEELGGTMRLGAWKCRLAPDSLAQEIYRNSDEISERHRHRYEFNPEFRDIVQQAGMVLSGESPDGRFVEIVELPRSVHPWFVACQFHPEYKSKPLRAHPLFESFIAAAFQNRIRNEASVERTAKPHPVEHERAGVSGDD